MQWINEIRVNLLACIVTAHLLRFYHAIYIRGARQPRSQGPENEATSSHALFQSAQNFSHIIIGHLYLPFNVLGTHTAAIAEFIIRRRLPHYIMGFYLPCIACTTASWLQFWMDQTAVGDRACLGITTVLTEIFLLEFSNQGMPKVSYMKAAELFLIVSFSFIFLALVESAIVYKATFWSLLKERKKKRVKKTEEPGETNKVIYTV